MFCVFRRFTIQCFLFWGCAALLAQTISGTFQQFPLQAIRLEGFSGLKTYVIDSTNTDSSGHFTLRYGVKDKGIGFIQSLDNKPFFLVLSGEDVEVLGEMPGLIESVKVLKGQENQWFEKYASEQPRREQVLSAWSFLETSYKSDPLFSLQKKPNQAIEEEQKRLKLEDSLFVVRLPEQSYVRWYLPMRKLVSSVPNIARYRSQEIPATFTAFRRLDYADPRLYKSGLFREAIDNHFWLIENSGRSLDSVYLEMKISVDAMLPQLALDEKKYNEVCDYLFDVFERRSLFQASEYLALKVLNESACTVDGNLARQMETYRAMKKGNIAPDFTFAGEILYRENSAIQKLSDISTPYRLVVFGAGWCPKCRDELNELGKVYTKIRRYGMEVVFVSLDEDAQLFRDFADKFPFISMCDYKKWENVIAQSYYVFGTPTMFLLDQDRKIVLRPVSVKQVEAWVDWFLAGGGR